MSVWRSKKFYEKLVKGVSRDDYEAIKDVLDGDPFMAIHYQFLLDEVEHRLIVDELDGRVVDPLGPVQLLLLLESVLVTLL